MVDDSQGRLVLDAQAEVVRATAPVGVLPVHEVALIQLADALEDLQRRDQARAGHPVDRRRPATGTGAELAASCGRRRRQPSEE